ncbi:hypothetical protein N9M50_02940 [Alphaproteobacteria bacterium]|nr:hypothetical protein [Alphaproteobacteria bacterium]
MRWTDTLPMIIMCLGLVFMWETPVQEQAPFAQAEEVEVAASTPSKEEAKRALMAHVSPASHQFPMAPVSQKVKAPELTPLKAKAASPENNTNREMFKALPAPSVQKAEMRVNKVNYSGLMSPLSYSPEPSQENQTAEVLFDGLAMLNDAAEMGFDMEIAWPQSNADRQNLFRRLHNCYGFERALLGQSGKVYGNATDLSTRSPFLRQLQNGIDGKAESEKARMSKAYGVSEPVKLIYLIDRNSDAVLLGNLSQHIQSFGRENIKIRGTYAMSGNDIRIEDITINGRSVPDVVSLSGPQCLY